MRRSFLNGLVFRQGQFVPADVHVADGRVVAAHPPGADVDAVDLAGAYVVPGLVDAHAHLVLSGDVARDAPLTQRLLKGVRNARAQLRAGVTSLRDVGGPGRIALDLAEAIANGVVEGPRVRASGSFLCATGGHVHYWGSEVDGADAARRGVRALVKQGAHFIKIMASGGVAEPSEDPELAQFDPEELAAICAAAQRLGRSVAAHAHPAGAIADCLRAGVRTIEHASFIDDEGCALAAERGAFVVPTFVVYQTMSQDPRLPASQRDLCRRVLDRKATTFLAARAAGVRWGVGTDAGSFQPQGHLWREMVHIAALGVPAPEVLTAATRTNAEILSDDAIGRLDPGCHADLLVVDQDPLADFHRLAEPSFVVQGGRDVVRPVSGLLRSERTSVGGTNA